MAATVEKSAAKVARGHTVYKNSAGKRVPGVTTITGVMEKGALKYWANQLGLQGIKIREYVDALAQAGTLAHAMIQWHLEGRDRDSEVMNQYSKDTIDLAETSALKFMYWQEQVGYEPIFTEKQLVSDVHDYGGTIDGYGVCTKHKDIRIMLDIKTAKAIYDDMYTQVAGGYGLLMQEHKIVYDHVVIVRVGRSAEEGTEAEAKRCPCPDLHEKRFLVCRELYELNKDITNASK
jgi:hypothetical protein